jgi:hypothetical protein
MRFQLFRTVLTASLVLVASAFVLTDATATSKDHAASPAAKTSP